MSRVTTHMMRSSAVAAIVAALAACGPKEPAPLPPPPPVVERVPYRPLPPNQAPYVMEVPRLGMDGMRQTPNVGISDDERTWYFRSAWNVAALNCLGPEHQPVLDAYSSFIKTNARALKQANDRIDTVYAKNAKTKRDAIKARETQMTLVYNYFALPPARGDFCRAALDVASRYNAAGKIDPATFAQANFAVFEQPFETFFRAYEQYERDSAAWDAQYGSRYGLSQPGYVAVQRARGTAAPAPGLSSPALLTSNPQVTERTVVDQATGATIPIVPIDPTRQSTPVVQPIPNNAGANDTPKQP